MYSTTAAGISCLQMNGNSSSTENFYQFLGSEFQMIQASSTCIKMKLFLKKNSVHRRYFTGSLHCTGNVATFWNF
jgi:hypothetical protein